MREVFASLPTIQAFCIFHSGIDTSRKDTYFINSENVTDLRLTHQCTDKGLFISAFSVRETCDRATIETTDLEHDYMIYFKKVSQIPNC